MVRRRTNPVEIEDGDAALRIILQATEHKFLLSQFDLTMDSSQDEILKAIEPMLDRDYGVEVFDQFGNPLFITKRSANTNTIQIFPKSTAG